MSGAGAEANAGRRGSLRVLGGGFEGSDSEDKGLERERETGERTATVGTERQLDRST